MSFKDNIKGKTTNPFFGTLIVVWIFHNWRLVYSIFNFESNTTLETRINFLATYFDSEIFLPNLLICLLITVFVLISTYILLNLSRLIVNFFEKTITPIVYKVTDKSSIVLKSDYELLKLETERFEKKFESEREARLKLQKEYEQLEARIDLTSQNRPIIESQTKIIEKTDNDEDLLRLVKDEVKLNHFKKMIDIVLTKQSIVDSEISTNMLRLDLVEKDKEGFNGKYTYRFTTNGNRLRNLLLKENIL
ncbi:MAG: hypothetical protein M0P66_05260 [Salinivirgaceae bacterium]|nr:hypothetical protein [Salinivirgaceae bacterium]